MSWISLSGVEKEMGNVPDRPDPLRPACRAHLPYRSNGVCRAATSKQRQVAHTDTAQVAMLHETASNNARLTAGPLIVPAARYQVHDKGLRCCRSICSPPNHTIISTFYVESLRDAFDIPKPVSRLNINCITPRHGHLTFYSQSMLLLL